MCKIQASLFYRFNAKTVAMATQQSRCKRLSLSAPSCSAHRQGIQASANAERLWYVSLMDADRWAQLSIHSPKFVCILMQLLIYFSFTFNPEWVCVILLKCPLTQPSAWWDRKKSSRKVMRNWSIIGAQLCVCVFLLFVCWWGRWGVCVCKGRTRKEGMSEGKRERESREAVIHISWQQQAEVLFPLACHSN